MQELANMTTLSIIGVEGDWYKVKLSNGTIGYCHSNFIKKGTPGAVQTPSAPTTTTPATPGGTTVTEATSGEKNILETMDLPADASGVTPEIAAKILSGLGYGRFSGYEESIRIFQGAAIGSWSAGKNYTKGVLDDKTKATLLKHAKMYKEALAKYPTGTISKNSADFNKWVSNAAATMKNMPSGLVDVNGKTISKDTLVLGIMVHESSKYHWRDRKVVISKCGAIGFMQIMPYHSASAGNIYDPEVNVAFGVKYIDTQLGRADWRKDGDDDGALLAKALAAYNCGPNRNAFKTMSWDQIVKSESIPTGSIKYAINIKKTMKVKLSATEQAFISSH